MRSLNLSTAVLAVALLFLTACNPLLLIPSEKEKQQQEDAAAANTAAMQTVALAEVVQEVTKKPFYRDYMPLDPGEYTKTWSTCHTYWKLAVRDPVTDREEPTIKWTFTYYVKIGPDSPYPIESRLSLRVINYTNTTVTFGLHYIGRHGDWTGYGTSDNAEGGAGVPPYSTVDCGVVSTDPLLWWDFLWFANSPGDFIMYDDEGYIMGENGYAVWYPLEGDG
jgi:hypothetical protein